MCIFEVLARPRIGVCVPLAFCLCHSGLFPSYIAQGLCFKAGLSATLLNNTKMILMQINLIFTGKVLHLASCVGSFSKSVGNNCPRRRIRIRGGSRGRVQGVRTPPRDDLRFSNTTGILQKNIYIYMWFIGVEVEQETSAPPPNKIRDPPLRMFSFQYITFPFYGGRAPPKQSPSIINDAIIKRAAKAKINWLFIFQENRKYSSAFICAWKNLSL